MRHQAGCPSSMRAALAALAAAALLAAGGTIMSHRHLATLHEHHGPGAARHVAAQDHDRLLLFVGGLQRSGTTALASALEALPDASGQSFAWLRTNVEPREAERRVDALRSWRGVTRRYLEDVIKSGGLEGKFAQNVYPYAYLLRDWGDSSNAVRRLALDAKEASPQKALRLWRQWAPYWNQSSSVLVEKTPENFVRGPFLEALFPQNARFVFVLRHPLAWALTIEKWLDNRWNFKKTAYLRDAEYGLDRRISMWMELVDRALMDVSSLKSAAVVHAEACSLRPETVSWSLAQVVDHRPLSLASFRGLARSNLAYVACWLEGGRTDGKAGSSRQDTTSGALHKCIPGAVALRDLARPRARAQLRTYLWGAKANALRKYGYFVPDFEASLCAGPCAAPAADRVLSDADVGLDVASIGDVGLLAALGLSGEPAPAPAASPDGAPN